MRTLSELCDTDKNVSVLNLSALKVGAGEAEALGRKLRASLSITSVDCSLNPTLGDEGARFLVPALRTDGTGISTIRVLSLMRCGIGDFGEETCCDNNIQSAPWRLYSFARRTSKQGIGEFLRCCLRVSLCQIRCALCSVAL